jgi:hypothetical protein
MNLEQKNEILEYEVNGKKVSLQEFQEMQNNPKVQLREIEPGKFKIFERLYS